MHPVLGVHAFLQTWPLQGMGGELPHDAVDRNRRKRDGAEPWNRCILSAFETMTCRSGSMKTSRLADLVFSLGGIAAVAVFLLLRPSFDLSPDVATVAPTQPDTTATTGSASTPAITAPPADNERLPGIDVSHYQGTIDWAAVKSAGIVFAYAKASDGTTYTDPKFTRNRDGALAQELPFGAYHFYEPKDDPVAQAKHFLSKAQVGAGSLPPVLDVERTPGQSDPFTIAEGAKQWLEYVEQQTGCRPMIYASPSFYDTYLGVAFAKYPLWLAEYSSKARLPKGLSAWQFWQHSQRGRVDGITGTVDLDYFAGDATALRSFVCTSGDDG